MSWNHKDNESNKKFSIRAVVLLSIAAIIVGAILPLTSKDRLTETTPSTQPTPVPPTEPYYKLSAPDSVSHEFFGESVSISGNKIVVGAPGYCNDNGCNSGSAFLFNTRGQLITTLVVPDGAANDLFGGSVSISGDTVVVGSRWDDDQGADSGSAYLFNTDGDFVAKLTDNDGTAEDYFGCSVALSTDRVVVGAYSAEGITTQSGSAYLFNTNGDLITKIVAPDGQPGDFFGYSVHMSDNTIVVGAYRGEGNTTESGSAYTFDSDGNFIAKLVAPDGAEKDFFGFSVSTSENLVLIGAWGHDKSGEDSGSAYIFNNTGHFITTLEASDAAPGDFFGYSVSLSKTTIVAGAWGEDDGVNFIGSAYVFSTSGEFITKLIPPGGASGDQFGHSVSVTDDKVVVGSWADDEKDFDNGSAHIFDL